MAHLGARLGPLFWRLAPLLILWTTGSIVVAARWHGLGLNLVADAAALWFGLLGIDVAVRQVEATRVRPAVLAGSQEALAILTKLRRIPQLALECTATSDDLPALRTALADGDFREVAYIMERLSFSTASGELAVQGGAVVSPPWRPYLHASCADIAHRIERFIPRYVLFLDPAFMAALRGVEECRPLRLVIGSGDALQWIQDNMWLEWIAAATTLECELVRLCKAPTRSRSKAWSFSGLSPQAS